MKPKSGDHKWKIICIKLYIGNELILPGES